jgi:hypothetical protein
MQEIWKDMVGYEELYQISNFGRVKSLHKQYTGNNMFLNGEIDIDGYVRFSIYKEKKSKHFKRSVLIARHFIPNPNNYPLVRHLNDIKTDDRIENLAWGTQKHNKEDAAKNGKIAKGENHGMYRKPGVWLGKKGKDHNMYGKTGGNANRKKLVLDTATGIFYDCIKDAAFAKGIKETTLSAQLRGENKNKTSIIYA